MLDISQPTRQSKLAILFYFFKGIKGLITVVLFSSLSMRSWNNSLVILSVSVFIFLITLISPVLQYVFFKFYIKNDELIIQKGWLFKIRKSIPVDRIQSINITQNIAQRILGIVAVEIDTAGSKAKELEIPALDRHFAEQLKSLLSEKKQISDSTVETTQIETEIIEDEEVIKQSSQTILKLNIIDILKVGITQNHLRSGGLALGVILGFWYKIKDLVERYFVDIFEVVDVDIDIEKAVKTSETFDSSIFIFLGIAFFLFLIVSVIVSLVMSINKFYDYKMELRNDYLEITMGLFNKKEIKIPLSKIQILEFHSNPLRKLLGFKTARIFQAQSQNNQMSNVEAPACHPDLQKQLQHLIFNEDIEQTEKELLSNPWSHSRLDMYIASVFALPLIVMAIYLEYYWVIIIPILFITLIGFMGYKFGQNSKVIRDDDFVVFYKGWLFNSVIISPVYKTQAVEKWCSIFIKSRGEAHLRVHTAGGSRQLKYLQETQINTMQNDINNTVIQSQKNWM